MPTAAITGTGLYAPPDVISNDELVAAFNAYVAMSNAERSDAIARGECAALEPSSVIGVVQFALGPP